MICATEGLATVWSSSDGLNWSQVTNAAPWGGRYALQVVPFNNQMWLMGGYAPHTYPCVNDVWFSQ